MDEKETQSVDVLELLLKAEPTKLPEKQVKLKRFSELCGADVIFKLRGLPYSRAAELQNDTSEDTNVHIVLAGVTEPSLKDKALMEKYSAVTPGELIKKMLLPGEIVELAREVEKLSGYRATTIEDVKKK